MKNAEFANCVEGFVGKGKGVSAGQEEGQTLVDAGGNSLSYQRLHRFDAADESIRKSLGQFGQAATGGGANVQKAAYIQSAQDGEQPLHSGGVVDSLMGMHGVVARGSFGVIPALGENRIIDSRIHIVIRSYMDPL